MRTRGTTTIALAACLAAVAGCGGNDKGRAIPAETRQELQKQLISVENRFEAAGGACADITENQASVETTLEQLPADVDAEVRDALNDGFGRLFELTSEQCDDQKGQETETTEEPPPVTTTEEPPPPTETQPEEQPKEDKGKGKGKGNGNDNGGGGLQVPGGDGSGGAAPGDG